MNNYLIVFNELQMPYSLDAVHNFIITQTGIDNWWHYLPSAYILKTSIGSERISNNISREFPGLLFFIVKLNLTDVNGVLPKAAWDWIADLNSKSINLKEVSQPGKEAFMRALRQRIEDNT